METELDRQIARTVTIWPVLKGKPETCSEIRNAVLRHRERITAGDITRGFDALVEVSPTAGWPPGPHEAVGCVLSAAKTRSRDERATTGEQERQAPGLPRTEVVGQSCRQCGGVLMLLPEESALYCDACGRLVVWAWQPHPRFAMTWEERQSVSTRKVNGDGAGVQEGRDAIERIKTASVPRRRKHAELVPIAVDTPDVGDEFDWGDAA